MKRLDNLDVTPAPDGEPIPTISATVYRMPDGTRYTVYDTDIPLEAFSDERFAATSAMMELAEQRALAKLEGRKVEN